MLNTSARLGVRNHTQRERTILVELWADAYTLLPSEELTIVARGENLTPYFEVVEWEDTTQVYCENIADFYVERDGKYWQFGVELKPHEKAVLLADG